MGILLAYTECIDGCVTRSSLEVLSRSREVADLHDLELVALLPVAVADSGIAEVSSCGPDRILTFVDPDRESALNHVIVECIAAVVELLDAGLVVFPSSESVKDILGALAERLDAAAVPDVRSFIFEPGHIEAVRPVMAARMLERVETVRSRVLISILPGSGATVERPSQPVVEEVHPPPVAPGSVRRIRTVQDPGPTRVDLRDARIVVAAGRGVRDRAGRELVEALADRLGAAVGATRALVEAGLLPASIQIGQTGKVVAPDLYFAVGVSGAMQHVAGIMGSRTVVAINRDADAPIFDYATYGIIGDLYEVLPELISRLGTG